MATVTTNVIQITVTDEAGYSKSFSLDDPKENITLNQINQAIAPALSGRWWLGNRGDVITALKSAQYTQTIKTQIAGETVSITPATLNIQTSGTEVNKTVTISGAKPTTANIENYKVTLNTDQSDATDKMYYLITIDENTVKIQFGSKNGSVVATGKYIMTGTLLIIINGQTFEVPITE